MTLELTWPDRLRLWSAETSDRARKTGLYETAALHCAVGILDMLVRAVESGWPWAKDPQAVARALDNYRFAAEGGGMKPLDSPGDDVLIARHTRGEL